MSLFRSKKRRRPARRNRRGHILNVTATAETARRRRNQTVLLYAGQFVVIGGLIVVAWMGISTLINSQIFENRRYNVRVVEVNTDGVMTREDALAKTGIREGLNIFSLNLEAAQRALASIPEVKEARIERILPDTVSIQVDARQPVAWVAPQETGVDPSAMESACLVDASGVMMKPQGFESGRTTLPVVYGVPTEQWRPGDKIEMLELHAALELLARAAERMNPPVVLRAADVSLGWCIEAWSEPQPRFTFGLTNISAQLDRLQFIMLHVAQTSRKMATANLIPERNTPVRFTDDPPARPDPAPIAAKKGKP
ncbi:MAG: cell division protein FtsQ/DivIB [Chthoniobacterales bacterium]